MIVGYARVSTNGQELEAQRQELAAAGCERVFEEKASGANASSRLQLSKLLSEISKGDIVVVTRLDRLARSTRDLLNVIDQFSRCGVTFRSLHDSWANTESAHGKLMLTVLGGLAEFERELIRTRTSEGRSRAKAQGVKFGRKPKLSRYQREEALARKASGESLVAIAKSYGVHHSTIWRLCA